ncbi:MAG TPA: gliding motility-associated C-terminal domain-containing protein, partial [Chitinophaga sp.]|uniref:HYR-like domain-containing protein n=1 Tax=Chitinophaga sp. TaxID=1869181 RepID=UPI002DB87313
GESIVIRWTIAKGTCTPSTDDVILVTYATPTVAAAGPDQKLCNVTSFNLAANTPTVGTGRWSVVYGSRTPASLTNANSVITVAPGDSIVLRWTVSNGTCTPSTDDVTLVSYKSAAPATAGPDQKLCNVTSFTLAANAPSVPTAAGRWSIIYGTATINNPGSPTSTVTVATGDSVVLRWTISNGSCPATTDDVVLVSYQQPTAAVAGPDQKLCNVASFTLAANAPVVGTGRWLVVYGTATFNNPNSPSAIATVAPGDSVVLRWTISNGVCAVSSDDVILVNYKTPAIANAGPDQEQCSNTTGFTMAANAPGVTGATGTWTITSGTAAIADIHSPTTKVTVAAGNVVTLRWTITNGPCAMTFDEVVIANRNPVTNNTISADQTVCLTEAPAALTGTAVTGGNGTYTYQWQSSTSGATAGFANIPGANGANYTPGLLSQDTWFRRVVTSGPCASVTSNAVKITVVNKPPVVIFVPGALTVDCKLGMDYTTLFGTPQFSHTPYNNMPLTVTFTDATSINGCTQIFTRTWTATDRCGMTTTASQTITVVDKTAPVFTTQKPADITVSCDAIPAAVNLTATDDCFGNMTITPVETRQDIPGACANNYKLIRTWTATDGCNNSTTLTQTITVQDKTPPVFTSAQPGDTIVNCNAVPPAMPLTAVDNCTPGVITVTATDVRKNIPGATCTDNYQIVRTWIATDECGNKATLVQNITVQDTTRPVFSMPQPANVTVDCDKVPAWPAITATDNCTASIQVMTSEQKFATQTCAGNYRLVRTWKATDNCGNTATMTQTITVQDTTRPVFTVMPPGDTMVNCNAVPPPPNNVMAVDNCGTVKLGRTQVRETIPGACASNYRLIRTWTATDECGNSTVWRQVITVQDTTRPVIAAAPADIVLNCGDAIPAAPTLTATDNCDPSFPKQATMVEDPYVKDLCAGYTITRRWKIADACGNQATEVIQRIVVNACPQPQLDPALPVNCSDNPTFTIKTLNNVENPVYTLVGVVPANAVQVPLSQQSGSFNLNNATQASFVVRNGVTGCVSDTVVYNLQYNTTPMVNLGRDTTICGGNSLILDAGAGNFAYNIRWSTGETTQRINVSTAGTYWVSVTNGICTTTDTIQVTVIPMPLVNIPDASICRGQSLKLDAFVDGGTYLWSNGATTSSILVSTQEQFWVKVVKSGCITIDTVNVTVNPPPDISLNRDTTICPDQSVMLTVNLNNGGNVRWVTGATTNSIVVNEPGQYWVTVTRDNCMVKDTVNVRLQPSINVDLGPNQEICPGSQITVDGTTRDAISYLWDDGDPNPVKNIWETGKYRLAVMDRFCNRVFYDSVNVRVASLPRVELGADTIMCIGETLRLRADGDNIKSVLWNDGSTGPFLDVTKAGTYSVTVFNDCGSSTDQITVDFTQCDPKPTFPNAFSPNGDGRNDYFRPVVRGPMYEYELRIFNRWGELIYLGYDSKKGWDGRYQGQPVTIGTYVWWLTYKKMPNGNPNIIKGEVTVIR